MMVHPSQQTAPHADYHQWVRQVQRLWVDVLSMPPGDPDRDDLIADFRRAFDDLRQTANGLPRFEDVTDRLRRQSVKQS